MAAPGSSTEGLSFGVFYDYRNPAAWRRSWTSHYRGLLEQARWVDRDLPYRSISVSEHHFLDDGYCPAAFAVLAALAATTHRVALGTNIMQLPLHHPLRVAEDALTVDALSGGRLRVGVANGYRAQEFEALGTSTRHRRERMEESLSVLRSAFAGEEIHHDGKHFRISGVSVTPGPDRPGGPPIWMGGNSDAAIDRAARLGDGFLTDNHPDTLKFLEACLRHGVAAGDKRVCRVLWALVTEDPEAAIASLGDQILYQINGFIDWGYLDRPHYASAQQIVDDGLYPVVDAAGAMEMIDEAVAAGVREFEFFAAVPGETLSSSSARLQYIGDTVVSRFGR